MSKENDKYWRKAAFDIGVHHQTDYLVKSCKDAKEWINLISFRPGYRVGNRIKELNLLLPFGWDVQSIEGEPL